ncbi:MAG: LytS/YhcK type 5TM receptor domain-containing protein [Desulfovibrionaceae bacterium]
MRALELVLILAERFGLLAGTVVLLLTFAPVRKFGLARRQNKHRTLILTLFFGALGIIGTYTGNSVFQSVANLRAMAVITGGLVGGPLVGIGAGVIAGLHRILFDLHGFSAIPCGLATFLEGAVAGYIAYRIGQRAMTWKIAAPLAIVGEAFHMILVLALSRPFSEALQLVEVIAPPMIIINALGAALFVELINVFFQDREKRESLQAQQILDIANMTVSHLRSGLNLESAKQTALILYANVRLAAVAITDTRNVLAHVGEGDDHHLAASPIKTEATREVLRTGRTRFITDRGGIGCDTADCPHTSAIIVPLTKAGQIVGTLKFYGSEAIPLNNTLYELGKGLGNLFSTQLELEDLRIKEHMLAHAEIRRLQAQINPHFLFNSLNTISAFCRTNAEKAQELMTDLSLYMRKNLDSSRGFIPLSDELAQVRSYLTIEKARFGDRINVEWQIDNSLANWPIPPLIIQPLVENCIRHGFTNKIRGALVTIRAEKHEDMLHVAVEDNGEGMNEAKVHALLKKTELESCREGIGVRNCAQRLEQIYGPDCSLNISSIPGQGTLVSFTVPQNPLREPIDSPQERPCTRP